ncbi:hypothetical protein CROQUDRAFT_102761 [Cronartium quercuum f. sp. fusiforme G11]|uniref:Uncharacterized protein n=1 Tax=Cronartium quercuum f. sp. fusiforme G11 TaxID=708437 RepID=A0A9P6N5G1_9BASI|nr:hypothetical protein CROQUDRAFT_102761 [Cronartium quercuum f. sp. fusiforme G11]
MSVNPSYIKDLSLLQSAYNHYVHYYMAQIYSKERKNEGKHAQDEERKVIQRARQRLRDHRYKFAVAHDLPKRYQDILDPINAHSDDEYFPKKDVYIVKKLPFRSKAATTFIRRLDEEIKKFNNSQKKRHQQRHRIRVKNSPLSIFPRAPDGLPLDFYDPDWFNSMLPARKQSLIGDQQTLAFLPNPLLSLTSASAPDEKLSDKKFTEKFWNQGTQKYDLRYQIVEEEDDDSSDHLNSYTGDSIDLNDTSGGDSKEEEIRGFDDDDMDKGSMNRNMHEVSYIDRPQSALQQDDIMDDGELEEFYSKSAFAGGLTSDEWNDLQ